MIIFRRRPLRRILRAAAALRWEGPSRPTRTSNFVAPADDENLSKDTRNIRTDLSLQAVNGNAVCASAICAQGSLSHGSNYEDIAKDDHPTFQFCSTEIGPLSTSAGAANIEKRKKIQFNQQER
ncbi:hypothetical protein SUNI508_00294 [Seiridium unicorne]|uniref:Uncharacterized protein n=1 Tax=Seiridium unicorne TaxID=138068 RepID=A0ABR2VII8_9PEZI